MSETILPHSETILPHLDAPPLPLPDLPRASTGGAPPSARAAGLLAAGYGLLLAAATLWIDGSVFFRLRSVARLDISSQVCAGLAAGDLLLSALLILGGLLLLSGKLRGRTLLLIFTWMVLPIMLAGMIVMIVAVREGQSQPSLMIALFWFHSAVSACSILLGLVLGWLLLNGAAARWNDAAKARPAPPALPWARPRMSVKALLSLIFAFLPPFGLMQTISLILGVLGMRAIRRSGGQRWGRGMAAAGSMLSLLILLSAAALCGYAGSVTVSEMSGRGEGESVTRGLMELDAAERLCAQLHPADPAASPRTITDLLRATASFAPVDPSTAAELSAADTDTHAADAQPYRGYFFKISRWSDVPADDASANYVIFAYPADSSGPTFVLDAQGQIKRILHLSLPPPASLSHSQADAWDAEKVLDAR
jgi:hypothetical protein